MCVKISGNENIAGGSRTGVSRTKRTSTRTKYNRGYKGRIRNVSKTVSNLQNQISEAGRSTVSNFQNQISNAGERMGNHINRVEGRGRPRLVPRSEEEGWEQYPSQEVRPVYPASSTFNNIQHKKLNKT